MAEYQGGEGKERFDQVEGDQLFVEKGRALKRDSEGFRIRFQVKGAVSRGGFDLKINRELADVEQEFRAQGLPLDTFKNFLQKLKVSVFLV